MTVRLLPPPAATPGLPQGTDRGGIFEAPWEPREFIGEGYAPVPMDASTPRPVPMSTAYRAMPFTSTLPAPMGAVVEFADAAPVPIGPYQPRDYPRAGGIFAGMGQVSEMGFARPEWTRWRVVAAAQGLGQPPGGSTVDRRPPLGQCGSTGATWRMLSDLGLGSAAGEAAWRAVDPYATAWEYWGMRAQLFCALHGIYNRKLSRTYGYTFEFGPEFCPTLVREWNKLQAQKGVRAAATRTYGLPKLTRPTRARALRRATPAPQVKRGALRPARFPSTAGLGACGCGRPCL